MTVLKPTRMAQVEVKELPGMDKEANRSAASGRQSFASPHYRLITSRLQSNTVACEKEILSQFDGVRGVGGYANRTIAGTRTLSDHALGLALDFMVKLSSKEGYAIAEHLAQNAGRFGVKYIIWDAKIFSQRGGVWAWRPYNHPSGRGGATLAHRDHVHVSFFGSPQDDDRYAHMQGQIKQEFSEPAPAGTIVTSDSFAVMFLSDLTRRMEEQQKDDARRREEIARQAKGTLPALTDPERERVQKKRTEGQV